MKKYLTKLVLIYLCIISIPLNAQENPHKIKIRQYMRGLKSSTDKADLMRITNNIANEYSLLNKTDSALKYYKLSIEYADKIKRYNYQKDLRYFLAKTYIKKEDYDNAIKILKKAYEICLENKKTEDAEEILKLLSEYSNEDYSKNVKIIVEERKRIKEETKKAEALYANTSKKELVDKIDSLKTVKNNIEVKYLELQVSYSQSQKGLKEKELKIREIELKILEQDEIISNKNFSIVIICIVLFIIVLLSINLLKKNRVVNKQKKEISDQKDKIEKRRDELVYLNQAGQDLIGNINRSEEKIIELLYDKIRSEIPTENIYFALYDESTGIVNYTAIRENEHAGETKWIKRQLRSNNIGKIDEIIRTGTCLLLNTEKANRKWYKDHDHNDLAIIAKSYLGIPISIGERVLGVISRRDLKKEYAYSAEDRQFIAILANFTAIALDNIRLFKESKNRIELLEKASEISTEISSKGSKEKILAEMINKIRMQLKCDDCFVFFPYKHPDEDKLVLMRYLPSTKRYLKNSQFPVGEGLVGKAYTEGVSILENDVYQNEFFIKRADDNRQQRSMLLVPIKANKKPIGVICADHDQKAYFTKSDQYFVELVANQVASGIERVNGFEILQEIGNQILRLQKKDGIKKLLEYIVNGAIRLTNTSSGVIYLFSENKKKVTDKFFPENDFTHPKPRLDNEFGITVEIINKKNILSIPDLISWPNVNPDLAKQYKSLIGVPLLLGENVIGVLYLDDKVKHEFSETEISFLRTLANQATIAYINAKVYEDINVLNNELEKKVNDRTAEITQSMQTLEIINEISTSIVQKMSIPEINAIVYKRIREQMKINAFGIGIFDNSSNALVFKDTIEDGVSYNWEVKLEEENSYAVSCYTNQQSIFIDDQNKEYNRYINKIEKAIVGADTESIIYIPLSINEKKIGVLTVQAHSKNAFKKTDKMFLLNLTNYIAIAIDNAEAYEELSEKRGSLEKMLETEKKLTEQTQLILSLIQHEYKTPLVVIEKTSRWLKKELTKSGAGFNEQIDRIIRNIDLSYQLFNKFKTFNDLNNRKKFEPVELNIYGFCKDLVSRFKKTNKILQKIELISEEKQRKVFADPTLLEFILINLLSNASKFSSADSIIKLVINYEHDIFFIEVSDNGQGIPENKEDQIFELFFRGENTIDTPGTGAGLAIVKKSAEIHQAKIEVNSKINEGTSFKIYFPLNYKKQNDQDFNN